MYSELCEKLFEQNANNYMAVFNELDKHFDTLVGSEKFMPYNEKIKTIAQWTTNVALFVKKYEAKLKYFWELRNHIAHGFKLDGKHYAIPSYHAVDELRKVTDAIVKPVTCGGVFSKTVYTCLTTDTLKEVMQSMKNFNYTHVPVYNEHHVFQWVLTQSTICEWLPLHLQEWNIALENVTIADIDLTLGSERYALVEQDKPLFSLPTMFETTGLNQKRLWVLLMTEHWDIAEPLVGIITTFDLPMITEYNFIDKIA